MQPAHQFMTISDWETPPAPARPPMRLYLPGTDCLYYVSGYQPDPNAPAPTAPAQPAGFYSNPEAPPATPPPATPPPATTPPPVMVPVYSQVDGGNTIPPDVVDPAWPVNVAPLDYAVRPC